EPRREKDRGIEPRQSRDGWLADGANDDACQHHDAAGERQPRMSQVRAFEPWKGLIGEAHDDQTDPAKNLCMSTRIALMQMHSGKSFRRVNPGQQVGAPRRSQGQGDGNARKEEKAVNAVLKPRLAFGDAIGGSARGGLKLVKKAR